ncbi:MAG: hypothetical protein PVF33_05865 [Candidatus Latescibacterota bacterium]|jgi:hypothetical protein
MKRFAWLALALAPALIPSVLFAQDFGAHWHDGRAELDGYRLTVSRYGQERSGHAVMIFVTEPFSKSKMVKVDDHTKNPQDTFDVLKLNLVRDFQTGIYDYNTMVSVFSRSADFEPVKVTFTSAEWCGNVYTELLFGSDEVRIRNESYFEDESGDRTIPKPGDLVSEDNLFILLRGLKGDYLKPGESVSVDYLPGVFFSRLSHKRMETTMGKISRRGDTETIEVPAGKFDTIVYDVAAAGRKGVFHVEKQYPHRIVRWELSPDVRGELTGSDRLQYWKLNREGDESYLKELGLPAAVK